MLSNAYATVQQGVIIGFFNGLHGELRSDPSTEVIGDFIAPRISALGQGVNPLASLEGGALVDTDA